MNSDNRTLKKAVVVEEIRPPKVSPELLSAFFCRDDNSRITAGKKQVKKKRGKVANQIRYLLLPMELLYHKFSGESGDLICKNTFIAGKPPYVLMPKLHNREQCLCLQCSNLQVRILKEKCKVKRDCKSIKHQPVSMYLSVYLAACRCSVLQFSLPKPWPWFAFTENRLRRQGCCVHATDMLTMLGENRS